MSRQYRNELLTYAIDNLNRLEEFDSAAMLPKLLEQLNPERIHDKPSNTLLSAWPTPEMLRQVVDRLNQWIRTQRAPADWQRDLMLDTLPQPLAELPQVRQLGELDFSRFDGFALQEVVWLRDVDGWAHGEALDDLDRASRLFDWTVRNIQLENDSEQRIPLFPWETLLFGRGTAVERAWLFILLARQSGIEAALLDIKTSDASPQPWCVAVLIDNNAYLFDPRLGLPIPAPNGITKDASGRLSIRPATLAQAADDDTVLQQLDANETHRYGIQASDVKQVAVMLEASPIYLAARMKLLESHLVGPQKMVLSAAPTTAAEHWKALANVGEVRLWPRPYETLQRREHLEMKEVQRQMAAFLPFYAMPQSPLYRGRVLYLKGRFTGDAGATHYFQSARPSNAELMASSALPIEKLMYLRAKQDASYWLGLTAYERENYASAVDYFMTRTLLMMSEGPWSDGARYNLARTYEATGDPDRAVLQLESNVNSPGYLGDLLRAKWLKAKP